MANTVSPNMGLIVPGVGTEPGPAWSSDLNSSLGTLDQHNHTFGQGVQINPGGLNINSDLSINSNNLTMVKTVNFTDLPAPLTGAAPNLGCLYVAGNELVYNDEAGNIVPITKTGSVNAGAGSITGLPSGTASASYSSGSQTFVFQSATNTPANIDGGSFVFRNIAANSFGVTLSAPNSLGANYSLVLPTVPAQTNVMTIDSTGNMGSITYDAVGQAMTSVGANAIANTRTRATGQTVAAGGVATSPVQSTNPQSTNATSRQDIIGVNVTITTTGRPVFVGFIDVPGSGAASFSVTGLAFYSLVRGASTVVTVHEYSTIGNTAATVWGVDFPAAGTYTYKATMNVDVGASACSASNVAIVAYEL